MLGNSMASSGLERPRSRLVAENKGQIERERDRVTLVLVTHRICLLLEDLRDQLGDKAERKTKELSN